jgi:thiamine pyrophosphate-dependent acetolactate synthase large subunit-like protein
MFASGLAASLPNTRVWAFMGDGAFCMNPGSLMVERQMNLPNLTHFLISNRRYGATSNALLPNLEHNDYVAIARGVGLERVFSFDSLESLERGFGAAVTQNAPGHTFVVLEVEPIGDDEPKLPGAPFDGPELKYRFGRYVERTTGVKIFTYPL